MTSNVWMEDNEDVVQTELHQSIQLRQSGSIEIESWTYNPRTQNAILTLKTEGFRPEESLEFVAQEKANPNEFLSINVLYEDRRDGYVVEVEGLSNQWGVMAVGVKIDDAGYAEMVAGTSEEEGEEDTQSDNQSSEENPLRGVEHFLQADQRMIERDGELVAGEREEYARVFVSIEIEETENEMKKEQEAIHSAETQKDRLYETVSELEGDQSYQTGEEVDETQIEIDRLNTRIRELDDDIYDHEMSIGMLEEKIKSLEEKQQTVAQGEAESSQE